MDEKTIRSAILACRQKLEQAGIDGAALEAELIVGLACRLSRARLLASPAKLLSTKQSVALRKYLRRRLHGTPFAYISGEKEFYGLSFKVGRGVLVPRPETELLVELVFRETRRFKGGYLADVCTGCGAVAIALAGQLPIAWQVVASDISPVALRYARDNASRHGLGRRIRIFRGDLYAPLKRHRPRQGYDLIVANPPYVATRDRAKLQPELRREPARALFAGSRGLDVIRRLAGEIDGILAPDGALIFELSPEQVPTVRKLLKLRFREVEFYKDLAGRYRVAVGRKAVVGR